MCKHVFKRGKNSGKRCLVNGKGVYCSRHKPSKKSVDKCAICLCQMNSGIHVTNCNHKFHTKCINQHKKYNDKCPLCRAVIGGKRPEPEEESYDAEQIDRDSESEEFERDWESGEFESESGEFESDWESGEFESDWEEEMHTYISRQTTSSVTITTVINF